MSKAEVIFSDIIIIGGGAAGFFTAVNCAELRPDIRIIILEKSNKLLSKVRVSGGGRCNVTHACFDNRLLSQHYPRGEKVLPAIFSRFTTADTIAWFERKGVQLKTEEDGRMFPVSDDSATIVNCLLNQAEKYGITIHLGVHVKIVKSSEEGYLLESEQGVFYSCKKLVIATGGYPKKESYHWIQTLGHTIESPVPSLFTFNVPGHPVTRLMGIAVPQVTIKIAGTKLSSTGPVLITHWGFSGPAVLKLSAWAARILHEKNYVFNVLINWLPGLNEEQLRQSIQETKVSHPAAYIQTHSPFALPKRLWEFIIQQSTIATDTRWAELSKEKQHRLIQQLAANEYVVNGKTTFKEEFVTCGGVSLKEIDFKTMESKKSPGLFFAGEVIDIDGITGGFNFQNAWSTAWIAAQAIGK